MEERARNQLEGQEDLLPLLLRLLLELEELLL